MSPTLKLQLPGTLGNSNSNENLNLWYKPIYPRSWGQLSQLSPLNRLLQTLFVESVQTASTLKQLDAHLRAAAQLSNNGVVFCDGLLGKCLHPEIGGTSVACKCLFVIIIWVPTEKKYATVFLKLQIASEQHLFDTLLPYYHWDHGINNPPSMVIADFLCICLSCEFSFNTFILICVSTFLFVLAVIHLTDQYNYSVSKWRKLKWMTFPFFFPFIFSPHSTT